MGHLLLFRTARYRVRTAEIKPAHPDRARRLNAGVALTKVVAILQPIAAGWAALCRGGVRSRPGGAEPHRPYNFAPRRATPSGMSRRTLNLDDTLYDYVLDHSLREHPAQIALREATSAHPYAGMQISPEQGQFMALQARLIGSRRALEIGVFTGYSALTVALALPDDGRLLACDISDEYTRVGRPFWEAAGVAHKIDLQLAPALTTLDARLAAGEAGQYDFAFIDADKTAYDGYYERCLKLLRRGGLIAIDNVLWGGNVARPSDDADTLALCALNQKLHHDERIDLSLLPIGDGLTLARKR
jgi:predicted O-methyltransferase YrrM